MADIRTLENIAAKARWLRSCEKQYAAANMRDDISEMNRLGDEIRGVKQALDLALQQCTT